MRQRWGGSANMTQKFVGELHQAFWVPVLIHCNDLEAESSWKTTAVSAENHWNHHEIAHLEGNSGAEFGTPPKSQQCCLVGTVEISSTTFHLNQHYCQHKMALAKRLSGKEQSFKKKGIGRGKPWEVKNQKERIWEKERHEKPDLDEDVP